MRAALFAAISSLVLFPSAAMAQQTCEQRATTGAVGGAVAGALLGGAVAGKDDRVAGAAIGGVAGALIGRELSKRPSNCNKAYGYYDDGGRWHASGVQQAQAQGYYDRDGRWVTGQPRGYYDERNVWIAIDDQHGYYDNNGRWVPPVVDGYYDNGNRWVVADRRDNNRRGGSDDWNDRRWERGGWNNADVRERADWLGERIDRAENNGRLSRREARGFWAELQDIKADEARMPRRRGELNYRDEQIIEARLDDLSADLRAEVRG